MKHRNGLSNLILLIVFLIGLSLLLYPTVSDRWNSLHQSRAIVSYTQDVAELDEDKYQALYETAESFNARIPDRANPFTLSEEERKQYDSLLDLSGNGVMGYIEIPVVQCSLPIYHGTQENVLQVAVGHIEWSSLPVGGAGTHSVLSGHRGLPSAKIFSNLDRVRENDTFMLHVLNETLTYEVDQILIVEPEDLSALTIEADKDYCTLVTCTPYGINTHRLLVRGHRIANGAGTLAVPADAVQIEPMIVAPIVAVPLLLLLIAGFVVDSRIRRYYPR